MPLHDFRCPKGHQFEGFQPMDALEQTAVCAECGETAQKVFLRPPFTRGDTPGYESPVTGEWVEGAAARRNDLAKNDCVPWEPGMREATARRRQEADQQFETVLEHAVESSIAEMPARKRERLEAEVHAGASLEVQRKGA